MTSLAGDSSEQQKAEIWMISALSEKLGVKLTKKKWSLEGGSYIELDGYCQSPKILCEAWAHIGPLKTAQKNKVMTDAFKLFFVNKLVKGNSKLILLFADNDAAAHFKEKTWMAKCLMEHNIIVEVIELPPELKNELLKAQKNVKKNHVSRS
ncbi:MAG: hypothetical protein D4R88_09600 [Methanosarcinales archaeon]|nr:MAG: hypothetical protein D4R88_09600 [Methanosarcinales archaeon]